MKRIKKGLSVLLVLCMVLSFVPFGAFAITVNTKPANGTTTANPFPKGTGGSNSFRIPAMVTLNDGTIVAAADARWNTTYDGGGLDTIVSYSTDNGASWNYTFANYLGDNGNTYNGSGSTAFIDPALATDGETVYMLCDLYPYGVALNGSGNTAPSTAVGFNSDGTLKLSNNSGSSYNHYLKDGKIYNSGGSVVNGYTVDAYFNITGTDGTSSNLFFSDSPYQVVRTGYLYLTKSTDGGKTWSAPTLIPNVKNSSEQVCLVGPGRGLVTSKGTIVFPVYSYNGSTNSQQMGFIYSSDNGATWTRASTFTGATWSSEAAVVELNDGTLRFFYRNGTSALCYADYSLTSNGWGAAVNTGIATNSNTQISAISYSKTVGGKQVILVSCPTGPNEAGSNSSSASNRLNGKIFVGLVNTDGTMSWQEDAKISVPSVNSSNQFMYSCLTELSDGSVAILYEDNESGWGTGYYYQMSFATYNDTDFGLTFDAASEPEDGTLTDSATGVSVSFGSAVSSMTVEKAEPAILSGRDYVAFDITVEGFSGNATVTIPLNGAFADDAKLYAVYIDDNGAIAETIQGARDTAADTFTFKATHFSTYAVVVDESGDTPTYSETKDITLTVGETKTEKDETGNYEETYNDTGLNKAIATVTVKGATTEGTPAVSESTDKVTPLSAGTYIIGNGTQWLTLSGNTLGSTTNASQATQWTVAASGSNWTIKSGSYYLYHGTDRANLSVSTDSSTWSYSSSNGFYYTYYYGYRTAYLRWNGSAWQASTYNSNNGAAYTYTPAQDAVEGTAYTEITFTGVSVGTTYAVVGSTRYNITVTRKTETVNLAVDGSVSYDDASTGTPVVANSAIATATLSDGKLTITGVAVGTTTITTDTTVYTVTVSDGTPISIKENETTTISVGLSDGQYVKWSSADSDYAGVAGKYDTAAGAYTNEAILAGQNVTDSPVVVTATIYNADGTVAGTQKWLVTVTEGDADTNTTTRYIYINVDTIQNCTVYYAINGGELIPVNGTGVLMDGTTTGHWQITFFAAPDDGYALTYMAATNSASQYYTLSNGNPDGTGSDAWPFVDAGATTIPSSSGDSAWKTNHGFRWALLEGNITIDRMKAMFSNAIALGCDGILIFTKNKAGTTTDDPSNTNNLHTSLSFVAQKLPTVEKVITSITRNGVEIPYTAGAKVKIGDIITYTVTVTRYATNADYGTITYTNEVLNDALTNNDGITTPDLGTSTAADQTYTCTTTLTLTKENFGSVVSNGTITNEVEFSYDYSAQYTAGSLDTKASAVANVTVEIPSYVVDFGLPVEINLTGSTDGAGEITKCENGQYGTAVKNKDGTGFIYTPNQILQGVDHVTFTYQLTGDTKEYEHTVAIYPATIVYYEEGFASYSDGWTGGSKGTGNQAAHAVGESGIYGYDDAYNNTIGASNNTEAVSKGKNTATLTFTGTGIDIYANTSANSGCLMIRVKNSEGTTVAFMQVDTHMEAGTSAATTGQGVTAYNVPVASITGLDHGVYTVEIRHIGQVVTDDTGKQEIQYKTVALDGFRIYGTMNDDTLHKEDGVYFKDKEDNPIFIELRDKVLSGLKVNTDDSAYASQIAADLLSQIYASGSPTEGAVVVSRYVVDGIDVQDLLNNGPKNEIYLRKGESLVFNITTDRVVQIGLKALNAATTCTINDTSLNINSSTDMFYSVPGKGTSGEQTITITNTGGGILSITKLKICDDPNASFGTLTEADLTKALLSLGFQAEPDPTPELDPTDPDDPLITFGPDDCYFETFTDCTDEWYHEAVDFAVSNGLMGGVGNSQFDPNGNMTRAMMVTVLYRMAGSPAVSGPSSFTDVPENTWYSDAVAWAQDNGIVLGVLANKFAPNAYVTREQIATILWRYENQPKAEADLAAFADVDSISDYAVEAMTWAVSEGIFNGDNGNLKPTDCATRAEFACIVMRYLEGSYNCTNMK